MVECQYCKKEIPPERAHQCCCPQCGSFRKDRRVICYSAQTGAQFWVCSPTCRDIMAEDGHIKRYESSQNTKVNLPHVPPSLKAKEGAENGC